MTRGPLPKAIFDDIYSQVPRLTVEVVIAGPAGVLLSLRQIEPCRGMWHLPGGTVRFGEPLVEAVKRVAATELGLEVTVGHSLGYIEYPSHYDHGLDCPVGLAFATTMTSGELNSDRVRYFKTLPDNIHNEQRDFLIRHGLVKHS